MKLSNLVKVWDILHKQDTGEIGFCDLANAIEEVDELENDISPYQPVSP